MKAAIAWGRNTRLVRVIVHFGARNGPIFVAGMAYQALFAVFAALWVGFSIAGPWIASNPALQTAIFGILNRSIPGLIGPDSVVDPAILEQARDLSWTGAIALVALLVTALGWLSTTRTAVRSIFDLPRPTTNLVILKLTDLGVAVGFGILILISATLSMVSTQALGDVLSLVGLSDDAASVVAVRVTGLTIVFLLDSVTLGVFFRILADAAIPWRRLVAGSLLGGAALGILKTLGVLVLSGTGRNPLLASFAVFVGLLIWFSLVCTVVVLSASWIAVGMRDSEQTGHPLHAQRDRSS